jgi:uncharacterized protein (DUF58 family)
MTDFPLAAAPAFAFDGVVRLTRTGTSYVLFTIVVGFAALNTGNNSLYIGLTFMLGCLLLSGVASKGGLKHLTIELERIGDVWAGQPAYTRLRIRNDSRIWNVRDVILTADELAEPMLIPIVNRRSTVEIDATFLFRRRGVVTLRSVDVYTRYPFGFFLKKRRIRIEGEVVVFPRLIETGARERFRAVEGEMSSANRMGPGPEIHSFREYVRGDSPRHVYWKKSASLGRWIMKQTEMESGRALHVVVDPYRPRGVADDDFERMISEAATLIHDSIDGNGMEVILTLPRLTLRAKELAQANALFRALALIEPLPEPFADVHERDAVVFTVRRDHAQTA